MKTRISRRSLLPTLLISGASLAAPSQPGDPGYDAEEARLEELARAAPKLHIRELRDYLRRKLDLAYAIALNKAVSHEHRDAIVSAQAKWLEFYEAQRRVAGFNASGGSGAHMASVGEGIYHLRQRIFALVTPWAQGWPCGQRTAALKAP